MKIIISVILIVNLLFTPLTALATEVESSSDSSSGHSRGGSFSLSDINLTSGGHTVANDAFMSFAGYSGSASDFDFDYYLRDTVTCVLSSFAALSPTIVDDCVTALLSDNAFMDSIFFNASDKTLTWDDSTGRHGGGALRHFLNDTVTIDVPSGFYVLDYRNPFFKGNLDRDYIAYDYYICTIGTGYFTRVGNHIVICNTDTKNGVNDVRVVRYEQIGSIPSSNDSGSVQGSWAMSQSNRYDFNDNTFYYYSTTVPSGIDKYPISSYANDLDACKAFYGFEPVTENVPNGEGILRPLPPHKKIIATSDNVYKRDWKNIITNNYNEYGLNFENTVVNNFYYSQPSSDTPSYWYNVYDSNTVTIINHDYDDLSDITLSNPNISTNHNFITDIFHSIPTFMTTLFISLLLLSIVIIFLKG